MICIIYLVGGLEHFLFSPIVGNNNPNWLIFFRGVGIPPTRYKINRNSWHQLEKFEMTPDQSRWLAVACCNSSLVQFLWIWHSQPSYENCQCQCRGFRFAIPGCEFIVWGMWIQRSWPCFAGKGLGALLWGEGRETHVPWSFSFLLVALLWIS